MLGNPSRKTPLMVVVEEEQGGEIPQLLVDLRGQGKTYDEIADAWNVSMATVGKWAKDFGVDPRSLAARRAAEAPQEQPS